MSMRMLVLLAMLFFIGKETASQTTVIVVMGSSTAAGSGASVYDSSWVGRLTNNVKRNLSDGKDTIVYNIALGGTTTYVGRENGFVPPQGYLGPDPDRNINKALSYNPNIIIVNYPSNDVANNMATSTTMANYNEYKIRADNAGAKMYFLTTQPRNTVSDAQKQQLKDQKGVIINTYPNTSINVWDILVAPDGLSIDPSIDADGTHVKDAGHRRIFEAVATIAAPAALPVTLTKFTGEAQERKINLYWETASEINNSHFDVERSANGKDFTAIGRVKGKGNSNVKVNYSYTDMDPIDGKNFYRLKQVDLDGKFSFSQVIRVTFRSAIHDAVLYPVPAISSINLKAHSDKKASLQISILDRSGNTRANYTRTLDKGMNNMNFPISNLPSGNYIMQIKSPSATTVRSFIKL